MASVSGKTISDSSSRKFQPSHFGRLSGLSPEPVCWKLEGTTLLSVFAVTLGTIVESRCVWKEQRETSSKQPCPVRTKDCGGKECLHIPLKDDTYPLPRSRKEYPEAVRQIPSRGGAAQIGF